MLNYNDNSLARVANAIDEILMSETYEIDSRVKKLEDAFFVLKDFILEQQMTTHFA